MRIRKFWTTMAVVACAVGVFACGGPAGAKPPTDEQVKKIEAALPESAPAKPKEARKVLVYTKARGFVHSSIEVGAKAIEMMGKKTGAYETTISDDASMFDAEKLKGFNAIVLVSTTGEFLNAGEPLDLLTKRRQAFMDFVKNGGGIMGIHAASDAYYQWPEYGKLIGGYFNGHPWGKITLKVDDTASPINAVFANAPPYTIEDEIYTFKEPYTRANLHVLLSVDLEKSNIKSGNRPDNDYAISWVRNEGKGRVYYNALGHREETFFNPVIMKHFLAGLQFALGDLEANAEPSAK